MQTEGNDDIVKIKPSDVCLEYKNLLPYYGLQAGHAKATALCRYIIMR